MRFELVKAEHGLAQALNSVQLDCSSFLIKGAVIVYFAPLLKHKWRLQGWFHRV